MAPPARPNARAAAAATPGLAAQLTVPVMAAIVLFVVAALLAVYYFVLYQPLQADSDRENTRRGRLLNDYRTAVREQQQYNDDVALRERKHDHARELARVLPDNSDIPGFMRSINTLAEASGLTITLIQPEPEHVEQYYARIPVRLEVTGSYLALARFFRSVSQIPRVINMENITLNQPGEDNGEVDLHARVLATTFRSLGQSDTPPPAATGPAGAPRPGGAR